MSSPNERYQIPAIAAVTLILVILSIVMTKPSPEEERAPVKATSQNRAASRQTKPAVKEEPTIYDISLFKSDGETGSDMPDSATKEIPKTLQNELRSSINAEAAKIDKDYKAVALADLEQKIVNAKEALKKDPSDRKTRQFLLAASRIKELLTGEYRNRQNDSEQKRQPPSV